MSSVARRDASPEALVDVRALEADLRAVVRGEVRFDAGSRALYATDASNYREVPIGVVVPRDVEDVVQSVAVARRYAAPVLPRGAATSQAGQCCNAAMVIDTSKYFNRVLEVDPGQRLARVQPGAILDDLQAAAKPHGLAFGPDPSTHSRCTMGGMIGNNSCGTHSVIAGTTADNLEEMEVLTYDGLRLRVGETGEEELARIIAEGGRRGEIYAGLRGLRDRYADLIRARFPKIPRRVSGYNLDQLLPENGFQVARALAGTEGTCVTILEATVNLIHIPPARSLLLLGFADAYVAADHVPEIMAHGPSGLEGFDGRIVDNQKRKGINREAVALLPPGGGWLVVEFAGETEAEALEQARRLMAYLESTPQPPAMKLATTPQDYRKVQTMRESGFGASAYVPGMKETWPGWEDTAVPPESLGSYLRELRKLLDRFGYNGGFYGHFGQACIHLLLDFDLKSAEGIRKFVSFLDEGADLVVRYGGSISGEHGDGQARGALLPKMFGSELVEAFRQFKALWDPHWKMNPGKVVDPYRPDEKLRLGARYSPPPLDTHFRFPQDRGSFASATLRCVGVGKCRSLSGGTMCPSFMVTREEKFSTRGRARLLFEMLQGDPLKDGWRSKDLEEALDLCLSCKGCKGDCPTNVDMATYKAEFLSHHYAGKLRPRSAYSLGLIFYWAQIASRVPGLANFFTQTPMLREVAKAVGGIAPQRRIPRFAGQTFKQWFRQRGARNQGGPRVLLWPDCSNNYFYPETARAAVEVLEAAGYQVEVPREDLCCGRPLYDYGMLGLARSSLERVLRALKAPLAAGVPLVGLEPSCVAVFRDELPNLFPGNPEAERLGRLSFLLSEFLHTAGYEPPRLQRKALVHGHCHHKAVIGMGDEESLLSKLGLDYRILDSGCCGMAGVWGFEKEHYHLSLQIGERVLLPAVRDASKDTLIVADGFSCREQIAQTTDRRALHLAQVIQMALREGPRGPGAEYPEREYVP